MSGNPSYAPRIKAHTKHTKLKKKHKKKTRNSLDCVVKEL